MFTYLCIKLNKKPGNGNENYRQGLHCHTFFSRN